MCGICGFAFRDRRIVSDKSMLQRMSESLRHRGPDAHGVYAGAGVGLGVRRLSIVDIETGDQPLCNETKSLYLICNGEIYNYVELRALLIDKKHCFSTQSDAEVILHLYEEYGVECVSYLRGMFSFALWDAKKANFF